MQSLWGKVDKFNIKICHFTALKCSLEKINYLVTMATTAYRKFPVNPQQRSDRTYWVAARCATEAFTCAVHIEECEGWWLSGCRGSVAKHWQLKPEVSWVQLTAKTRLKSFSLDKTIWSIRSRNNTLKGERQKNTNDRDKTWKGES